MVTLLRKIIGDPGEKAIEKIAQTLVPDINSLEGQMQGRSDEELFDLTRQFRDRLARGEALDEPAALRPSPQCGRWPAATWASAITTYSLSGALCCTGARSPK